MFLSIRTCPTAPINSVSVFNMKPGYFLLAISTEDSTKLDIQFHLQEPSWSITNPFSQGVTWQLDHPFRNNTNISTIRVFFFESYSLLHECVVFSHTLRRKLASTPPTSPNWFFLPKCSQQFDLIIFPLCISLLWIWYTVRLGTTLQLSEIDYHDFSLYSDFWKNTMIFFII